MIDLRRISCAVLCLVLTATSLFAVGHTLDDETHNESRELYDNVTLTHVQTDADSRYGLQNLNIVEFDPSDADLYIDVVGAGKYANDSATVPETVAAFIESNPDLTPIAAVNGDLWMASYAHSRVEGSGQEYGGYSDAVVKKTLSLPRGFNAYGGEIICSAYMYQETPYEGEFWSFGVSESGKVMIGCPTLDISIGGSNISTKADGLNRLPANDALVVYTDRGCLSNYALDDAYELLVKCDGDYTVKNGTRIAGEIIGIYGPDTDQNPEISEDTIILTARGSAIEEIGHLKLGDRIAVSFEVGERYGRNVEEWKTVTDAVGGHMPFVVDGVKNETGLTKGYPSTIVGITNDGKVLLIANDGRQSELSRGLDFNDYAALTDELGINTGIILDGGGSTTMVVLDEEEYKVVNSPSDGSPRSVVNSLILSYGPEREKADTAAVIPALPESLTSLYFTDDSLSALIRPNIQTKVTYSSEGALIQADKYNGDGYININFGMPGTAVDGTSDIAYPTVDIDEYPYIVLDMRSATSDKSSLQFQTFYVNAGDHWAGSGDTFCCFNNLVSNGQYSRYVIDTTANPNISGQLNSIRLGYLFPVNGTTVKNGDGIYLRSIRFAKTLEDANSLAEHIFSDVAPSKWYSEGIGYCYKNGYMAGTSDTTFSNKVEVTRAMFATILAALDNADLEGYTESVFDDVENGKWYTAAITWANEKELAAGLGNGNFGPKDPVTREQIALFLFKFAQYKGIETDMRADLSGYNDEARIHSWAYDAVSWAVKSKLISGVAGDVLSPRTSATRAEVAVMLMQFTQNISPVTQEVDLIMFCGQSNMAGRGNGKEAPEVAFEAGAEFRAVTFPAALFPIDEGHTPFGYAENNPAGINDVNQESQNPKKKGGIVPAFINSYYEQTGTRVIAVSASCGSSLSSSWIKEKRNYYQDAIYRYNSAAAWLEANGYTVRHRYLVWLQGESDAKNGIDADTYISNVNTLLNGILTPATGIEKCFVVSIGQRLNDQDGISYAPIIEAQERLCSECDNFVMASRLFTTFTDPLCYIKGDPTHFRQEYLNRTGADAGYNAGYYANHNRLPEATE